MNRTSGLTVVEVTIVVAILLLLTAISLPALVRNREKQRAAECAMNLDAVATACQKFAAETGGFPKKLSDLVPAYLDAVPACPAGGTYALGAAEGAAPTCSVPGHHF